MQVFLNFVLTFRLLKFTKFLADPTPQIQIWLLLPTSQNSDSPVQRRRQTLAQSHRLEIPPTRFSHLHRPLRLLALSCKPQTSRIRANVRANPDVPTKRLKFSRQLLPEQKPGERPSQAQCPQASALMPAPAPHPPPDPVNLGLHSAGQGPTPLDLSSQKPHVAGVGPQATCSHHFVSSAIHWGRRRQSEPADPGWSAGARVRRAREGAGV